MSEREALRKEDAEARLRVQRGFERPIVLAAGAGTGKTAALVARIVAWCVGPGWERAERRVTEPSEAGPSGVGVDVMSRVVAITFTEAAAAEMSSRVLEALTLLADGTRAVGLSESALPGDAGARRARSVALIDAFDHLTVRTIHAYCRRLLARFPLEAGLHPGFEVDADERIQAEVVWETVEEAVREAYRAGSEAPLLDLAAQGFGPPRVEETLALLVMQGADAAAFERDPLEPARVAGHLAALGERAADLALAAEPLSAIRGNTAATLEAATGTVTLCARGVPEDLDALEQWSSELRALWIEKATTRLKDWSRGKFMKREAEAIGAGAEAFEARAGALLPAVMSFSRLAPRRLDAARRALAPLLAQVQAELRVRGAATYASLLVETRDLLARRPDVLALLRRELDQLLVDEFQDTDGTQCELVRLLALSGPVDERPGLFLVGDPKQSIYGWRSADLRAYDDFVHEVVAQGGERLSLSVNFRSVPAILEEVERVIEPAMVEHRGLQPAFQPLVPCEALQHEEGFAAGEAAPVEYWVSWRFDAGTGGPAEKTRADEATDVEAVALARDVRLLHDEQGVAWSRVALLLRGAGDLDDYLAALRERGVPYVVERDRSYYRRREVIEAAAWIRCVLDPADPLALLTLLRSSAVGVPDAALVPLWGRGLPRLVAELRGRADTARSALRAAVKEVAASLPLDIPGLARVAGWEDNLAAAVEALAALRESFARDPADVFVERLRELSALDLTEASRHLGAYRAANLERLFRELASELGAGGDVHAVLRRLRVDVERARDAEEERPKAAALDAVQVMTIHKAKGLDFDHVYLAQLHKRSGGGPGPVAELAGGDPLEYRVFDVATLGFEARRHERAAVEAAERVRTLYVAMTRAKQRLVLMGSWPAVPGAAGPDSARSHVDLLTARRELPTDLPDRMTELATRREARFFDAASARWSFPGLPAAPSGVQPDLFGLAEERSRSVPVADVGEVAAQARALAGLRERAESRMEQPRGAAASAESHALLREQRAEQRYDDTSAPPEPGAQGISMAAGSAVHRVLEDWVQGPAAEDATGASLRRLAERLPRIVEALAPREQREAALRRAREGLDRFAEGPLFARLREVAPHVVASEMALWLPADDPVVAGGAKPPLDFVAGAIDLVFRDPEDGRLVVVDYKTDRVAAGSATGERARAYAAQGRVYARGLEAALALDASPRIELWFLHSGEIVTLTT